MIITSTGTISGIATANFISLTKSVGTINGVASTSFYSPTKSIGKIYPNIVTLTRISPPFRVNYSGDKFLY